MSVQVVTVAMVTYSDSFVKNPATIGEIHIAQSGVCVCGLHEIMRTTASKAMPARLLVTIHGKKPGCHGLWPGFFTESAADTVRKGQAARNRHRAAENRAKRWVDKYTH
jgi:hypothetical protein